ncbi:prkc apoptosis wt1 regulator protein [Plakobranchus ocellatus]|uniref:Prkc apoptosis wt1 regulator protein n=1 Tax=Plakobranchus ocellatus TaxID=259542 RepID=A0AAV4DFU6_9GAST|nr:prkc apoptosis wt1 regulator protein [Plakobranchus ocellatus]
MNEGVLKTRPDNNPGLSCPCDLSAADGSVGAAVFGHFEIPNPNTCVRDEEHILPILIVQTGLCCSATALFVYSPYPQLAEADQVQTFEMASSSVSQESLDMDDFDTSARRNRIRVHRGHSGRGVAPFRSLPDRGNIGGTMGEHEDGVGAGAGRDLNGEAGDGGVGSLPGASLGLSSHTHHTADHESPTRSAAARLKDKQRGRPNHMKGKLPKDKRKLREKRRSTGVVHCMPSTESTGDSLDDDDDDELVVHDTKKNTLYNESSASGHHHHQSLYEARSNTNYSHQRRNKSPSDLEADLEDNQDYDSTVSHSETNLSLIGRSESSEMPAAYTPGRSVLHHHHQTPGKGISSSCLPEKSSTGNSFPLKYSPETNRAMKFNAANSNNSGNTNNSNNGSSDADSSSRTNTPSTSSSSSVLSRWRDYPDTSSTLSGSSRPGFGLSAPQPSPDSPRRFGSAQGAAASSSGPTTTASPGQDPQAASNVSSSGSSGSITGTVHSRPLGFSVFRDGNSNTSNTTNTSTGWSGASKSSYSGSGYMSPASRLRDRDGGGPSSIHTRMANYQSPRPYGAPASSLQSTSQYSMSGQQQQQQQNSETVSQLEKQLEKEREDNKRLQQQLEEKEKKIAELEKAIELLNSECDGLDEDNLKLQEENQALIRAMSKLTSNV